VKAQNIQNFTDDVAEFSSLRIF